MTDLLEITETEISTAPDRHFKYLRPEIPLIKEGFTIDRILIEVDRITGFAVEIIKFPDVDELNGRDGVHVCIISNSNYPYSSPMSRFGEKLKGSNSKIEVSQMSEAQKQRWNHCRNILKLPYEVSAQLTFNDSERNLSGWIVPDEDVVPTRLISLNGLVKSGKSLIAAFLSIKEDLPVFSLDKFSVYTVDAYLEELKANGISKDSNAAEFIKVISEFINRNPKRKMDNRSAKSLRETLNELTNFFEKGYRPKVMLIDGVGDKPEGVIPLNAYHLASLYGSEASILIEIPELANNLDLFEYGRLDVRQEVPPYFVFYRIRHPGVGRYTGDIDTRILPDSLDVLLTEFRNKIKEKSDF